MNRLQHFQKYHLWYEVIIIVTYFAINNTILATSVIMEAKRAGDELGFELWEPFVWEYSSALSTMILLWPFVRFIRKYPFQWESILRSIIQYFVASIIFSLAHVGLMVAMRKSIYWAQSRVYEFGDFWFELLYEYRKDLWGFIFLLIIFHGYQFIVGRILGEANLIGENEGEEAKQHSDRILVKKLGKEFIVKIADIEWLESSGNYVNLHIKDRIYPTRSTLSRLIKQISDKGFCRIHRSFGVNLDQVDSITSLASGDGEVKLKNGRTLNLSRRYKEEFKQQLSNIK